MVHVDSVARAEARLAALPRAGVVGGPTPLQEMVRLRAAIGGGPRLLVKRDDAIPFAFGGNKVRKLEFVAAQAVAEGADTLVTIGGIQSNHARATAAVAARLGLRCTLVLNGEPPARPRANTLLDALLGADVEYVPSRGDRVARLHEVVDRLQRQGRRPAAIPIGASTGLGAYGYALAVRELLDQEAPLPDVIVHATSSGGTQAGLVFGLLTFAPAARTRVIGVSADEPASTLVPVVHGIITELAHLSGVGSCVWDGPADVAIDEGQIGPGYGAPTPASEEAQRLAARAEALFVDHTYTAKALAAVIALARSGEVGDDQTILFWHTGGQVGLFA